MSRVYLKRTAGDFGEDWTLNLQEQDGTASDLTGATAIRAHWRLEGDRPGDPLRLDKLCPIAGAPTLGQVTHSFVEFDLIVPGKYFMQVEAIFPARQLTWDYAIVMVERQYG